MKSSLNKYILGKRAVVGPLEPVELGIDHLCYFHFRMLYSLTLQICVLHVLRNFVTDSFILELKYCCFLGLAKKMLGRNLVGLPQIKFLLLSHCL